MIRLRGGSGDGGDGSSCGPKDTAARQTRTSFPRHFLVGRGRGFRGGMARWHGTEASLFKETSCLYASQTSTEAWTESNVATNAVHVQRHVHVSTMCHECKACSMCMRNACHLACSLTRTPNACNSHAARTSHERPRSLDPPARPAPLAPLALVQAWRPATSPPPQPRPRGGRGAAAEYRQAPSPSPCSSKWRSYASRPPSASS